MQDGGIALYRRFLEGDVGGLEALISLYQRGLFRFIYGYVLDEGLAEDVMQEVFVRIYCKRSFKEREGASFKTYLYKIARNTALNAVKKRKRKREVSLEGLTENAESGKDPLSERAQEYLYGESADEKMERAERARSLRSAIDKLNESYQEVLRLRYFENASPEEISKVTGRKIKQVYNLLTRGKLALKEELIKTGFKGYQDEDE